MFLKNGSYNDNSDMRLCPKLVNEFNIDVPLLALTANLAAQYVSDLCFIKHC